MKTRDPSWLLAKLGKRMLPESYRGLSRLVIRKRIFGSMYKSNYPMTPQPDALPSSYYPNMTNLQQGVSKSTAHNRAAGSDGIARTVLIKAWVDLDKI
jgi:hypothetical protein